MKALIATLVVIIAATVVQALVVDHSSPRVQLCSSSPRVQLCSQTHKRRKKDLKKSLHDIARNDSRNEYFAGGQSEEGGGSATVLVWPDEDDGENKTDTAAEPEEPVEKFTGAGRKL